MEKSLHRGAGILMPISSLPSNYGIGTMGKVAYEFINELVEAGQTYWQVLPIGPTSYGDSPYQSFSTFAGNPYFIDLDILIERGLLTEEEVNEVTWCEQEDKVSYDILWNNRYAILKKAYERSQFENEEAYHNFERENAQWLWDYALYMACKAHFGQKDWSQWDDDIKYRNQDAINRYHSMLEHEVKFYCFIQYEFYSQWNNVKQYANQKGIKVIGDIPIYVALDSVDVWKNPQLFQLNDRLEPVNVAGCPPDAFSDEGQKWGNPLYDWNAMEAQNFEWWKQRIAGSAKLYDVIRIDHFIGIVRYYSIPANESAKNGWFEWGPGKKLTDAIDSACGDTKIIAEDLGVLIPEVRDLLKESGYPGMKVLEFAFDGDPKNEYLPHNYPRNCVVYGGTHDNETLRGYYDNLDVNCLAYAMQYTDVKCKAELISKVFVMAYRSVADTVIFQMQDVLEKENDTRMNIPATLGENWRWRMKPGEFTQERRQWLGRLAAVYNRN